MRGSPFDLGNASAYRAWRDAKLAAYPRSIDELVVPLADPRRLSAAETAALNAASDPHPADYPYGELGEDQRAREL